MTKEITKAYILQQIQDKFKLREHTPEKFTFGEEVIPTYDVGQHLMEWSVTYKVVTIFGTGGYVFFEVPETERWTLSKYNVVFISGAFTIAGVYISRLPTLGDFLYLDLTAAQNVSYAVNLPQPVILDAGDRININVDGFTSGGDLRIYIDYQIEVIR